ncbi:hypothetical protein ROLI_024930 [Roseobacter fucihabitans]|uniref:Uncharacterized protein n=1 Tax=Roseobacter fucihabitans TaxID=1537242 RepID=A0ABZ2BTP6_9RHOB|nr:hypothetical protein [Roseobacter litoralis]MBC6965203.1 hypothetical protein [Roseobacter litoralis]
MLRYSLACVLGLTAFPALAQSEKEVSCTYQAQVVGAIKQARLDRVPERKLQATLAESATWPEKYNNIIPIVAPSIYEKKRRDLRDEDLAGWWQEQCMALEQ